jgi:hypothetical protein
MQQSVDHPLAEARVGDAGDITPREVREAVDQESEEKDQCSAPMICARMARSSSPRARRALSERYVVMPTMNRKNGKTRSVGVHPCQGACSSGG